MDVDSSISAGDLLTIVIALSAYLVTISIFALEKLTSSGTTASPNNNLTLICKISIPDFFLILSAIALSFHLFRKQLFCPGLPFAARLGITAFLIAGLILVSYHVAEWYRTYIKITSSDTPRKDIINKPSYYRASIIGGLIIAILFFLLPKDCSTIEKEPLSSSISKPAPSPTKIDLPTPLPQPEPSPSLSKSSTFPNPC